MSGVATDPALPFGARLRLASFGGIFTGATALSMLAPAMRRARQRVQAHRDVAYGPLFAHKLDVFLPPAVSQQPASPLPILIYIHGGGFAVCSKETHEGIGLAHAYRGGFLVFNIDYRLAPQHRFPAAIEDCCLAYRWVVEHCADYGGDPMRIVVAGESAGANLALGVAIAASYRRPEPWARAVFDAGVAPIAVQPTMPFLQVSDPAARQGYPGVGKWTVRILKDIARAYLGPGREQGDAGSDMADPIRILEAAAAPERPFPEVWTGVGSVDICKQDAERLDAACTRLGIAVTTRWYEGENHAFTLLRWRDNAKAFWRDSYEFLKRVVSVEPPLTR